LWVEQYDKSDTDSEEEGDDLYADMTTYEQKWQMFSEESDDEEYFGFESIFLTLVHLICGFDSRGFIYPKKIRCVLYASIYGSWITCTGSILNAWPCMIKLPMFWENWLCKTWLHGWLA